MPYCATKRYVTDKLPSKLCKTGFLCYKFLACITLQWAFCLLHNDFTAFLGMKLYCSTKFTCMLTPRGKQFLLQRLSVSRMSKA